jgi:hypothetical protein
MSVFLNLELASDRCGVSSRKAPSTTGTNGNSQMPKVPHSLSTSCLASLFRRHSAVSDSFVRLCGQLTASAKRRALKKI